MSQKAELASILAAKNMLADGKFVPASSGEKDPLGHAAARVRAIEWYLNAHRSLAVLAPWFEGQKDDPFAPGKAPEESVRELLAAFGLTPTLGAGPNGLAFNHYADTPTTVSLGATARMIGPVVFQTAAKPLQVPLQTVAVEGLGPVEIELDGDAVDVRMASGERLSFDLAAAVEQIESRTSPAKDASPIALKASSGGVSGTLLIDRIAGTYAGPEFSVASLRFWLVLDRAG
jgi:hypothetical protein